MQIAELKNRYYGRPAFCLGTAPHLNQLDLSLLRDHVTIGCNQLALRTDELNLKYTCFQRDERFQQVKDFIPKTKNTSFIIPENILLKNPNWDIPDSVKERVCPVHLRYTTPGHAEYFSFDLENCLYAGDSIAIEIQLAVWMGCNPIYILGVDASYADHDKPFYDNTKMNESNIEKSRIYYFPDLCEWLKKVKNLLWTRGVKIYNAAGKLSSLDVLPTIRFEAALGNPKIAVTSKTFSNDQYLVKELKRYFPDVTVNNSKDQLEGVKLVDFLKDSDGLILGTEPFTAEVIRELPCLRFVSKYGVGVNNIDFNAAKQAEMEIVYRKGVNSDSVAELTLAFALMLIRNIDQSVQSYRKSKWNKVTGRELSELTIGIIGYGHVGKVVAQKFASLRVGRLLVNDLLDFPQKPPCEFVPLDYLLRESDIVTIHVDAENRNHHFVNEDFFRMMKDGSWLINTSRGNVLDELALIKALKSGKLAGAALDVYEHEPAINRELSASPNLLTTCHIAGTSNRAIKNMGWAAIEGLLKIFNMEPV